MKISHQNAFFSFQNIMIHALIYKYSVSSFRMVPVVKVRADPNVTQVILVSWSRTDTAIIRMGACHDIRSEVYSFGYSALSYLPVGHSWKYKL